MKQTHSSRPGRALIGRLSGLGGVLLAGPAWGHAFGEPVQLPMPYELYILGATVALVLSFVILALFGRTPSQASLSLILPKPTLSVAQLAGVRLVSALFMLASMVLCVVAGFIGSSDSHRNINMTYFWILFVLGGAYVSMFVGNWYAHGHPFRLLLPKNWGGVRAYPKGLGHWPALFQFFGLIVVELFLHSDPRSLAWLILAYVTFNGTAMWLWGTQRWLQRGELFYNLFRFFAACSPLRRAALASGRRAWRLTVPFADLRRMRLHHPAQQLFVFFLLSSTAFDGLRDTQLYFNLFWQDPLGVVTLIFGDHPMKIYPTVRPWFVIWEAFLLLISPFLYWGLFSAFLRLGRRLAGGGQSMQLLTSRYLASLVPIAVVYHVTHYYTLILSQGVKIRGLVSDPLGWGWNLFGSAITGRLPWLPDMSLIWASQVVLILLGHVAAVWLAHYEALRLERSANQAVASQLPMLILMVVFTGVGLWILAQPLKG